MNSLPEILNYAVAAVADHRDDLGEIMLTDLEEDVMLKFEIDDEEFEDLDLSFLIWQELDQRGHLSDD